MIGQTLKVISTISFFIGKVTGTQSSTEEIRNMIERLQQGSRVASEKMQQNKENADKKLLLDAEKLNFEGKKLEQKDEMDKEKLQSQEDQADLRAEVALAGQRRQRGD